MNTDNLLDQETHFAFGKNWQDYAQKIDESRIASAVSDLQRLSGRERPDSLSFLDIGCGSGLHALAAGRLGAARVIGVDIDSDSVEASRQTLVREHRGFIRPWHGLFPAQECKLIAAAD